MSDIRPARSNRVVCYCDDCQSFAHFLGKADRILDAQGGTDIFQTSPARLAFARGTNVLACVQLRKGSDLVRWYTACCSTPIGNTLAGREPFVGLILHCAAPPDSTSLDDLLGPARLRVNARFAKGDRASLDAHDGLPLSYYPRLTLLVLGRWLRGDKARSPFIDASGKPVARPRVLSDNELRDAEAARDAQ